MNVRSFTIRGLLISTFIILGYPSYSQPVENDPPMLAHQPLLIGVRGEANTILAHVTDRSGIADVHISVKTSIR